MISCLVIIDASAQTDSSVNKVDSFLMHQKGLLGKLAHNLMSDKPASPNAPVRQIWVSAMSRSFKLAWDDERKVFALNGESLADLLRRLATEFVA